MNEKYDYGFLDYNYYGDYNNDPLYILMINEQFEILRDSFYELDDNTRNILNYFIIEQESSDNIDVDLDKYIKELKNKYLDSYNCN